LTLAPAGNGDCLALAYENSEADLVMLTLGEEGLPMGQQDPVAFRYLLPEIDAPVFSWGGGQLLIQTDTATLMSLTPGGNALALEVPRRARGQLSSAQWTGNSWVATFSCSKDTWIVHYRGCEVVHMLLRQRAEVTTMEPWADAERVTIGFSNNTLATYDCSVRLEEIEAMERRHRPICVCVSESQQVWMESDGSAYAKEPRSDSKISAIFPPGSDREFISGPHRMLKGEDDAIWLRTPRDIHSFRIAAKGARNYPVLEIVVSSEGGVYAIQKRDQDLWLIDCAGQRESRLLDAAVRVHFAVDGNDRLVAIQTTGGAVQVDLKSMTREELHFAPSGVHAAAGGQAGVWLADAFGAIHYLHRSGNCDLATRLNFKQSNARGIYSWGKYVVWYGSSGDMHRDNPSGDHNLYAVFLQDEENGGFGTEPIGRRMFRKSEGPLGAVCHDPATDELILFLNNNAGHGRCAKIGTPQQFLSGEERDCPVTTGALLKAVVSKHDDCVYGVVEEGDLYQLDRSTLRRKCVLPGVEEFTRLSGSARGWER
jgi:hypothetical protein